MAKMGLGILDACFANSTMSYMPHVVISMGALE